MSEAPPPRATIETCHGGVALQIPGLGRVRVTAGDIAWQAAVGVDEAELTACLGEWAWSQQQLLRGWVVCRGTALVTERGAVLLAARSGEGASLTAASLVLAGTPVLADGACPLTVVDGAVLALPGRASLELDAAAAASWPHPDAVTAVACGRARVLVQAAVAAEPAELAAVVLLRRGGTGGPGALLDAGRAADMLRVCLVPSLALADRYERTAAAAEALVAAVPVVEVTVASAPPLVALSVMDALATIGVGV